MSSLRANIQIEPQDLNSSSATQGTDLGALATTGDGRYFRYCLVGGTSLVPGKLQQSSAEDTTNLQNLTVTAPAVGATSIVTTSTTTLTLNQLAGALLTIASATTNAGYVYKVKGNTAASTAVATIYLEDAVLAAPTGTTTIDIIPNIYSGVIVNPSSATSAPVGVAVYPVTNAQYGWILTHGPASILSDGGSSVGTQVVASNATPGAVEALTGTQAIVGTALTGVATTEYGFFKVTLD